MDTATVLAELDKIIGKPPVWNPENADQTLEFNRWKSWSAKVNLRNALLALYQSRIPKPGSTSTAVTPSVVT